MNQIILRERVITIPAGDTFDQALQGNVLRVTSGNVPLRVQNRNGGFDFTLNAGERAQFDDDNEGLILSHTSGVAQTFTIQVGKGVNVASALVSGVVSISGTPTVINGGGTLTSITNPVKIQNDGLSFGASYKTGTAIAGNTPATVFSAASNVNGAIIHDARFWTFSPSGPTCTLIAKPTAPINVLDGDVVLGPDNNNGSGLSSGSIVNPIFIPAGYGLFWITNINETSCFRSALYTLK